MHFEMFSVDLHANDYYNRTNILVKFQSIYNNFSKIKVHVRQ